jgi:hypothetical protein
MEGLNDDASGGEEKIALMVRSKYSKLFLDWALNFLVVKTYPGL